MGWKKIIQRPNKKSAPKTPEYYIKKIQHYNVMHGYIVDNVACQPANNCFDINIAILISPYILTIRRFQEGWQIELDYYGNLFSPFKMIRVRTEEEVYQIIDKFMFADRNYYATINIF